MKQGLTKRIAGLGFAAAGMLFVALSAAPSLGQQAGIETAQSATFARRFTMGVGRSIIIDLPRDAAEIVVANPAVANAVVRSPRKIYLLALAAGQTTIFALDQQGRQIANLELTIGRDVGELSQILRAALPKSEIVPRTINDTIILTGFVDSAGEAQQAVDIARGFASKLSTAAAPISAPGSGNSSDGGVVNSLVIRGRDQVSLKVTIAEVQRQILKQLGVSTNTTSGEAQVAGVWGSFKQDNPFSLNGQVSKSALQFLGPNNTSVTLNAFERYGVSRVLAEPTVTAVSGESAKFLVGGEVPVPSSSSCTAIGTTTQALCTPSIAYKKIGIELNRSDGRRHSEFLHVCRRHSSGLPHAQARDFSGASVGRRGCDGRPSATDDTQFDQRFAWVAQSPGPRHAVSFARLSAARDRAPDCRHAVHRAAGLAE
jgi:pilus assembly protein CpaC